LTIWKFIENSKLTREQKIEGILTQGVNIAEQLGNLGKLASGTKLDYVLNYTKNKIELSITEVEKAKNFIENSFVGFFAKPTIPQATPETTLPTNDPINTEPSAQQISEQENKVLSQSGDTNPPN
jgi:hypothetical protein